MNKKPFIYIMASKRNGTLYIGVTSNLPKRVWEHKNYVSKGFTQKYKVHNLVYYEAHASMEAAITREKQMKVHKRPWKCKLIEEFNPEWQDLYEKLM